MAITSWACTRPSWVRVNDFVIVKCYAQSYSYFLYTSFKSSIPLKLLTYYKFVLFFSRDLSIGRTEFEHDLGNCNIVLGTATRNHQNAYEIDQHSNGLFVTQLRGHLSERVSVIEVLRANQRGTGCGSGDVHNLREVVGGGGGRGEIKENLI